MRIDLEQGSLLKLAAHAETRALEAGALKPIPTRLEIFEADGVRWLLRILEGGDTKDENRRKVAKTKDPNFNPFLPYDTMMEVGSLSSTHVCLLNKFPVMTGHLLMITKAYENQLTALTQADMMALLVCLRDVDGLGFYNGGKQAGASQHHKHLQIVPFPLEAGLTLPVQPFLRDGQFPFTSQVLKMEQAWWEDPERGADHLLAVYRSMLAALDLGNGDGQPKPYNFLATREYCWMVPREQEFYEGIGMNSLGFAGSFFVRNEKQKTQFLELGPLKVLKGVVA